jgi:hypothetical protein
VASIPASWPSRPDVVRCRLDVQSLQTRGFDTAATCPWADAGAGRRSGRPVALYNHRPSDPALGVVVFASLTLRRVLDLEACKVEGDPQVVFAAIEEDLREWL